MSESLFDASVEMTPSDEVQFVKDVEQIAEQLFGQATVEQMQARTSRLAADGRYAEVIRHTIVDLDMVHGSYLCFSVFVPNSSNPEMYGPVEDDEQLDDTLSVRYEGRVYQYSLNSLNHSVTAVDRRDANLNIGTAGDSWIDMVGRFESEDTGKPAPELSDRLSLVDVRNIFGLPQ